MHLLIALLVFFSSVYAEQNYQIIEDKATLPLLNPAFAERKTTKLRLNNGLEAYLISDPSTRQSAATLCVDIGSWNDPKEYPGTAHFLEHMLFLGTTTYPQEDGYWKYILDHGGKANAFTASDRTAYMFSIDNDVFEEAFDRFAHFFIDPLFSPSGITRELHAVDQEHSKNIEHDGWRQYMIFKETGNPLHPNAGFCTGNAKTLGNIPQEVLRTWYSENYIPQKMHLIVLSSLPIDNLIAATVKRFTLLPAKPDKAISSFGPLATSDQKGHFFYIKPIKDLRVLLLTWELPSQFVDDLEQKNTELLAYLVENSSESSLLQQLKREKIAEDLHLTVDRYSKTQAVLQINIDLTIEGVEHIDTAIERVFQTLAGLKQTPPPASLFEELQTLARIDYQYQPREEAFEFAMEHASSISYEPLDTYPQKSAIPSSYDPEAFATLIQELTPQQCIFSVIADPILTHVAPTRKEKWMQAEYAITLPPEKKMGLWAHATSHPGIKLPPPNPYVPLNLATLSSTGAAIAPQLIADDESGKVYFAQDNRYRVPELAAFFSVRSPLIDGSAKQTVLLDLYQKALEEQLSATLFFADRAGLNLGFKAAGLKFLCTLHGYSDKALPLLREVFSQWRHVHPSADQFLLFKQALCSVYENSSNDLPFVQARSFLSNALCNDSPLSNQKLEALRHICYEEFTLFCEQLFTTTYVEALLYGNLDQSKAQTIWNKLKNKLSSTPYPSADWHKRKVLLLPEKQGPYMLVQATERQGHAALLTLQEGTFSFERKGSQQILATALQQAFFDTLRTKQQTGYIAKAWDLEIERQLMHCFAVQSSTHHPSELLARFELFLEDFLKNFTENLPEERFTTLRKAAIAKLKQPPENLCAMAENLYTFGFEYEGDFQWLEKREEALTQLTYADLVRDAHTFLGRCNPRRLAICIEGVPPPEGTLFRYAPISQEEIKTIGTYVAWK